MTDRTTAELAQSFIEAWARSDLEAVKAQVADDVHFEGPMASAEGVEDYLEAVGGFSELVTGITVLAAVGDERQAIVLYDMATEPFGTLRAAEHLTFDGGRITSDTLVFDTHPVRGRSSSAS